MTFDLDRFVRAQDGGHAFVHAIAELNDGAKRSHWIWFVFPQLAGLGSSPMADTYGLHGVDEATAYLRDRTLRDRLLAAMNAVRRRPVPLRTLMGSQIDALKLVSSMTLFREAGRRVKDEEIAAAADEILSAAKAQGYAECAFTLTKVRQA